MINSIRDADVSPSSGAPVAYSWPDAAVLMRTCPWPADVPDARIVAEGGRATGGGGRELKEGDGVTLLCSVHADPPVYNITWLHNVSISLLQLRVE